ncbi:Hypothetical predicted protein [Marmota monax]|uniref:Cleavage and polyadenylation specificity factor subunit 4 n=1 Tax=Marmota monax TaxID=9995 RepID=A0A5E4APU6_MARMO|nr:Hypothetical predicted protein [Marmota monax]
MCQGGLGRQLSQAWGFLRFAAGMGTALLRQLALPPHPLGNASEAEAGQLWAGKLCPFRHEQGEKMVVCKHWLRGLCKKGDHCRFLHQYDVTRMPRCYFYSKFASDNCSLPPCPCLPSPVPTQGDSGIISLPSPAWLMHTQADWDPSLVIEGLFRGKPQPPPSACFRACPSQQHRSSEAQGQLQATYVRSHSLQADGKAPPRPVFHSQKAWWKQHSALGISTPRSCPWLWRQHRFLGEGEERAVSPPKVLLGSPATYPASTLSPSPLFPKCLRSRAPLDPGPTHPSGLYKGQQAYVRAKVSVAGEVGDHEDEPACPPGVLEFSGDCHNKECTFLHVKPASKSQDCPWYDQGFCRDAGPRCKYRHVPRIMCLNYFIGFCPEGPKCQFTHPKMNLEFNPSYTKVSVGRRGACVSPSLCSPVLPCFKGPSLPPVIDGTQSCGRHVWSCMRGTFMGWLLPEPADL